MKPSSFAFIVVTATLALTLSSCSNNHKGHDEICCCPPVTRIYIQPLNTYSKANAETIAFKLEEVTEEICMPVAAEILPPVQLGDEFKNDASTRYRADKILDWLKTGPKPVIALINDDISCTHKDIPDWGVLGLSYLGKDVCVVSTYRVKNKRDFWKVVYHEFGHAHYGLPHCPADDPTCIMQDAKGHPNFAPKRKICHRCWGSLK